jgi:hypothetical protein
MVNAGQLGPTMPEASCMPAQVPDKPCRVILSRPDTGQFAIRYPVAYLWVFAVIASYLVRGNPE